MLSCCSFKYLHVIHLFLLIFAVRCFNERCSDINPCSDSALQCRFGRCFCPVNEFWTGPRDGCVTCPDSWINLLVFCIYYNSEMMHWSAARDSCHQMESTVTRPIRLLELSHESDFDHIHDSIQHILTQNRMVVELNISNRVLYSAEAFVGSHGRRVSAERWMYQWENDADKAYGNNSEMWCAKKTWQGISISVEPLWENQSEMDTTFQLLKRWGGTQVACLASSLPERKQPSLCEIIGEPRRVTDQSLTSFIVTTRTTTLPSSTTTTITTLPSSTTTTTRKPSLNISVVLTTTIKQPTLTTNLSSLSTTSPSITTIIDLVMSTTTSTALSSTTNKSIFKQKGLLFIVTGTVGLIILAITYIFIINRKYTKKDLFLSSESDNIDSLSYSKTNEKHTDDMESNSSSESHVSMESTDHQSQESQQQQSDTQSVTPSKSSSIKTTKLALWDQMESSLLFSNPSGHQSSK